MTHYTGDDCPGGHMDILSDENLKALYANCKELNYFLLDKYADELQRRGYRVSAGRITKDPKRRKNA